MKLRATLFTLLMLLIAVCIGWIFWEQELKYAMPTNVPTNFVDVEMGEQIDLSQHFKMKPERNVLLHFFNEKCPCSKFNMKQFEQLTKRYKEDIDFYIVLQSTKIDAIQKFKSKYELDLEVILDVEGVISDKCGIYATPQAVILDKSKSLFYKGNYNKARFCTRKETRFVDVAIKHLLAGEKLPQHIEVALTQPYGCTLPSDKDYQVQMEQSVFNIFNRN